MTRSRSDTRGIPIGRQLTSPCPNPAQGYRRYAHHAMRALTVRLDDDTFDELIRRANKEHTSVGEQVRKMVEWGLESC